MRSYSIDRVQDISISGKPTSCQIIETGVHQMSIHGLLFFLLHGNEITNCGIKIKIERLKDNTSTLKSGRKNDTHIQKDVKKVMNWYTAIKFPVNLDKCEI